MDCSARKIDVRLPGKGDSNSLGARPVHLIILMIRWIQTSRLQIKNSLSSRSAEVGNWSFPFQTETNGSTSLNGSNSLRADVGGSADSERPGTPGDDPASAPRLPYSYSAQTRTHKPDRLNPKHQTLVPRS